MTHADDFIATLTDYAGREFIRKSVLSIRAGAGVIEYLLGTGKYRRVLEIGTYRGVSSAYMSRFCERVTTIDLVNGKMEQDRQVFDRVRFWTSIGIGNIDLRLVESETEKAAVVEASEFDFALIDGDHEGNAPARDFQLVKRCGAVLFHDYEPGNDVARFVDTLPAAQVTIMDIFAFWQAPAVH